MKVISSSDDTSICITTIAIAGRHACTAASGATGRRCVGSGSAADSAVAAAAAAAGGPAACRAGGVAGAAGAASSGSKAPAGAWMWVVPGGAMSTATWPVVPDRAGRPHTAALQEVMLSAQRAATMPHATMQMTSWQKNTISSSLHAHRAAVTHAHDACTHSQLHVPAHASQRRACTRPERARSRPCTSIHADCHHLQRVWPGHDDSCGCVETPRGACLDPGPTRKEDHHNLLLQSGAVAPDIPREGSRATQHGGCMGTGLAGAPETMGGNRLGVCGHGLRRPPRPTVSACRLTGGYVVVAHRVGGRR